MTTDRNPDIRLDLEAIPPGMTCPHSLESLKGLKGIEYRKAWNRLHRDRCRKAESEWRKRNPGKVGKFPQWLRDEYRTLGKRKKHNVVYYGGWDKATMRCEPWGVVEDCIVMDRKMSDRELSLELGRSIRAIQVRRCKLKKQNIEDNSEPSQPKPE